MAEPVAWDVAERVAVRVAGRDPFADSYHFDSLVPDFEELTAEAEELVADATGLRSLAGPARAGLPGGGLRHDTLDLQRLVVVQPARPDGRAEDPRQEAAGSVGTLAP